MGKAVEIIALERGHTVSILPLPHPGTSKEFSGIDCAIDFSHHEVALTAITECLAAGMRVVSGTTGWNRKLEDAKRICAEHHGTLCWSPNYSLGMNITLHINGLLADIMNQFDEYAPHLLEIHHKEKKDTPSGTAIAMANQVIDRIDRLNKWQIKTAKLVSKDTLPIDARREKDVKGIHRMTYESKHDTISLRHHALSRDGFALGAIIAAEWLEGKTGFFTFDDVLNFNTRP